MTARVGDDRRALPVGPAPRMRAPARGHRPHATVAAPWRSGADVTGLQAFSQVRLAAWLVIYMMAGAVPAMAGGGGCCSTLHVRVSEMPVVSGAQR